MQSRKDARPNFIQHIAQDANLSGDSSNRGCQSIDLAVSDLQGVGYVSGWRKGSTLSLVAFECKM